MKQITVSGLELTYDDDSSENFFEVLNEVNNALQDACLECQPQISIMDPSAKLVIAIRDYEDDESQAWECKDCSWLVLDNEGENGIDGWLEQDDGTIAAETPCPRCGGVMLKWPEEDSE